MDEKNIDFREKQIQGLCRLKELINATQIESPEIKHYMTRLESILSGYIVSDLNWEERINLLEEQINIVITENLKSIALFAEFYEE